MPGTKKMSAPKKKVVKKGSKSKEVVETTLPVETVPVETTLPVETSASVEDSAPVDTNSSLVSNYSDEFTHLLGQLRSLQTTLKELTTYTVQLEKRVAKDQRIVQKRVNGRKKRVNTNNSPSGFSKPGPVSDELRSFLNLGPEDLIARTEVTKRINLYCKEHGLQGEKDKRILNPDKQLKTLLRLGKGDALTFFNLQKYMKVHFPNKEGVYPTN